MDRRFRSEALKNAFQFMENLRDSESENLISNFLDPVFKPETFIRCYQTVSSVLDVATELSSEFEKKNALILAKKQTKGRGQQGRTWEQVSDAFLGCLVFSDCKIEALKLPAFSLVVAIQLAAIMGESGVNAGVKWPNDVLTQDLKKISGVLLETDRNNSDRLLNLKIGIGVNFRGSPEGATSLAEEGSSINDIPLFASKVFSRCHAAYLVFKDQGFRPFVADWNTHDLFWGKEIVFQEGGRVYTGMGRGVNAEGQLQIEVDGKIYRFSSGQIKKI